VWSLSFRFSNQDTVCISYIHHACYMPRPSHPPLFDHPTYIWNTQWGPMVIPRNIPHIGHLVFISVSYSLPIRVRMVLAHTRGKKNFHTFTVLFLDLGFTHMKTWLYWMHTVFQHSKWQRHLTKEAQHNNTNKLS
jgi:hypothetical protein